MLDALLSRIHAVLVGSAAHSQSPIVRAVPYLLEAAFWAWFASLLWCGLKYQLRCISGNTPELPTKMPGTAGFAAPVMTLPDGTQVRARATPDWSIDSWVPIAAKPPSDPKVMR